MIAYFLRMFKAIRKLLSKQEEHRSHSFVPPQQDVIPVETNPPEAFNTDFHLVELLRIGDETAFTQLFNRYYTSMLRLTHIYASEYAKEIVQETWFMVLQQLDRFHGQITLKVWIFRALRDSIEAHLQTEGRSIVDFSQQNIQEIATHPTVAPWRFFSQGNPNTEGRWFYPPQQWQSLADNHLDSSTIRVYLQQLIQGLVLELQEIVTLRDIEGWTADEVCSLFEIIDESQRVLLHHARTQYGTGLSNTLARSGSKMETPKKLVCKEFVELVTDYLEKALLPRTREAFEAHLIECPYCPTYFEQMQQTIHVLRQLATDEPFPETKEELIKALQTWKKQV